MNILVAEDERSLGDIINRALPRMITGSKVLVLADAMEMLTTMQTLTQGDKANWPDVVVSDFHLINGNGGEILRFAAKAFPDAKLILMSGGADSDNVEMTRATVLRPFTFLPKPFELDQLICAILA